MNARFRFFWNGFFDGNLLILNEKTSAGSSKNDVNSTRQQSSGEKRCEKSKNLENHFDFSSKSVSSVTLKNTYTLPQDYFWENFPQKEITKLNRISSWSGRHSASVLKTVFLCFQRSVLWVGLWTNWVCYNSSDLRTQNFNFFRRKKFDIFFMYRLIGRKQLQLNCEKTSSDWFLFSNRFV